MNKTESTVWARIYLRRDREKEETKSHGEEKNYPNVNTGMFVCYLLSYCQVVFKSTDSGAKIQVQIPPLPLTGCVSSGKWFNLSVSVFPHLKKGGINNSIYLYGC